MTEETMASARKQQIVQAASGIFLRYGFARTTMSDIAEAAGLTRPTLYQSFPDKEAVFWGVIDAMAITLFAAIREGLPAQTGLEAKLRFACEAWGVKGFELEQANPDAKDMFDLCIEPVKNSHAEFEKILVDILHKPLLQTNLDIKAKEIARIIIFSMKGFKETAHDSADMRRLIAAHIAVIAAGLEMGRSTNR